MTTIASRTFRASLNEAPANQVPDLLKKAKLGNYMSKIKVTFAGLTSAAAQDITTAAAKAAATISGIELATGENLPPIDRVLALRVTAGAAAAGARIIVDTGGTAGAPGANGPGIVKISDDGKTLTFEAAVTGFVLVYQPLPAADLGGEFQLAAP